MSMNRKVREIVYNKYNGHCAYCGCKIEYGDMQVDDIVPKCRGEERWVETIGTDDIDNLNPSCKMCNFYKGMRDLESFRTRLKTTLIENVTQPFNYRLAKRYGMVREEEWDGKFYFEK